MLHYYNDVFTAHKAAAAPTRSQLVIIETAVDSVIPCLPVMQAARALLFPAALDILPPFPHDYLGAALRIALQPSTALRGAVQAMQQQLRDTGCSRCVGIHLRGGFVAGDFALHENRRDAALARVVQAARQLAEEEEGSDNSLSGGRATGAPPTGSKACFIVAGDNAGIRQHVLGALRSWGATARDIGDSTSEQSPINVGVTKNFDAACSALQQWFMLASADVVVVQPHSTFGLSAGIFGGARGATVAEHRVISGFSCFPWYLDGLCAQDDGGSICRLKSL